MNPVPKDSQSAKLARFQKFISEDRHRRGSLGYHSYRQIALDTKLSMVTVTRYMQLHYPSVAFQIRKLR